MFNELSVPQSCKTKFAAHEYMIMFSEAMKAASEKGFQKIRLDTDTDKMILYTGYSLKDWLNDKTIPERYKTALFGTFIKPFIAETEEAFNKYDKAKYYFEDKKNKIKRTECLGLAAAYIHDSL